MEAIERLKEVYDSISFHHENIAVPSRPTLREWREELDWVMKEMDALGRYSSEYDRGYESGYEEGYEAGYENARDDIRDLI